MYAHSNSTMSARLKQWWLHILIGLFASVVLLVFWLWPRYTEWRLMHQLEIVYLELAEAKMDIEIAQSQGKLIVINNVPKDVDNPDAFFSLGLSLGQNTQAESNPNCIRSLYLDHIQLVSEHAKTQATHPFQTSTNFKKWEIVAILGKNSLADGALISFSRSMVDNTWQCVIYQHQAKRLLLPNHMPHNCRLAIHPTLIQVNKQP